MCMLSSIYLPGVPISLLANGLLCIPVLDSTWKGKADKRDRNEILATETFRKEKEQKTDARPNS